MADGSRPSPTIADRAAALREDIAALAAAEPLFAKAAQAAGDFDIPLRPPGFGTLLHIILEQQVSTASAAAMWRRLKETVSPLTPEGFLTAGDDALKACGFSRQKTAYGRALAAALAEGRLELDALDHLDDEAVIEALCRMKGIGRWSAENYLLWALGRRDVLPAADLALLVGWQWLAGLDRRPTADELRADADRWRPRRTAASLLLWRYYIACQSDRKAGAAMLANPALEG